MEHGSGTKGPDVLERQNLFGPSNYLYKICLCQIFNLSRVGALRHSRIFVNHKCQSHGNKNHRLRAVRLLLNPQLGCFQFNQS